ncbi:MAG TPA: IclR family transcriptional regulator [Clostridia bacterium]|nr:IclR family transcriptional regulator [Clostridia bacterium]
MPSDKIIQSVSRAVQVLNCFEKHEELGVTEISKMMELHKSTAFGLIATLEECRLLEKNEDTGKYRLGLELFRLGTKVNSSLRGIVIPYLERLVSLYGETVNLVSADDTYVIYLEKVESSHSMRICTMVGGRLPIYCTAVGKAILANLPEAEADSIIERMDFRKFTDNTICDKEKLLKYLAYAKEKGYAEESEELELGLSCVAAPIFNHFGRAFAAISVSGPASRMTEDFRKKISISLMEFTQDISRKLGYVKT